MIGPFGETLGMYLRRQREARSVSLEELSFGTRMNIEYLKALERDDFQCFPQKEHYMEGFLRTYARYVRLDPEEVLRRFHLQTELARMEKTFHQLTLFQPPAHSMPSDRPARKFAPRAPFQGFKKIRAYRKILLKIGIVIVAIAFSLFLRQVLQKTDKANKPLSPKAAALSKTHSVTSSSHGQSPLGTF